MQTITDLRRGKTQDEMTDKLSQLVQAVHDTGRGGSITLTLKVSPAAKDSLMMKIDDVIVLKSPEAARSPTLLYRAEDNSLTTEDPEAETPKSGLRSVDSPTMAPAKDVVNG
jgi:hypothetical protein